MSGLPCLSRIAAVFLAALLANSIPTPVEADKVGVAAAVHPDAFSGGAEIKIGKAIFFNERISTSAQGLVQVLLIDGSTFTVGPGSDLTIDKFVYNPKTQSGEVAATFTKGVMRFVGGKISKQEGGVTVKTPSGALAIRGGMAFAKVTRSRGVFSFLYGDEMRLTLRNGRVLRTFEKDYTIDTAVGVRPTTPQDIKFFMQAFAKGSPQQALINGKRKGNAYTTNGNLEAAIKNDAAYTRILNDINSQMGQQTGQPPHEGPPPPPPPPTDGPSHKGLGWGVGGTPPCPNCSSPPNQR